MTVERASLDSSTKVCNCKEYYYFIVNVLRASSAAYLYLSCNLRLMNAVKVQSIHEPYPLNIFVFINIHQIYGIDFFVLNRKLRYMTSATQ